MSDSWAKQTWSHKYYHFCLLGAHLFYSAPIALYLFMVFSPPPLLDPVIWMAYSHVTQPQKGHGTLLWITSMSIPWPQGTECSTQSIPKRILFHSFYCSSWDRKITFSVDLMYKSISFYQCKWLPFCHCINPSGPIVEEELNPLKLLDIMMSEARPLAGILISVS